MWYIANMGNREAKGGFTLLFHLEGDAMMITYSDLVQTGIFIVVLVNLCYQIFKGRK